ncbi:MAG: HAD-IA family hydrolase [Candidatus Limiplasma sp.]|nr:HAD-IA family hydrolase [Candidatus Limiplasma sp.]
MKYDLLLADADGTLFDFLAGERIALQAVLKRFHLPEDDETAALYSRINESHWKRFERGETTQAVLRVERFRDFLETLGASGDAAAMSDAYVAELGQQRILLPGALALCQAVSTRMPVFLITNGLSKVQRSRFEGCIITPYLAGLLISEETGRPKPDPYMLLKAMELSGVSDPRRAVMLGDSVSADIAAANAAGVDSVLFLNAGPEPQGHGATYTAASLQDAQRLILQ